MFGDDKTYFADSPVVIDISGLEWGAQPTSPFTIVRTEVIYDNRIVGEFKADTGRQTSISFDISSALRAIWSDYGYTAEVAKANAALTANGGESHQRAMRQYSLQLYTEYLDSHDGELNPSGYGPFAGGQCLTGGLTEWERAGVGSKENADASHWEGSNLRNGDASTKPVSSPERVGSTSITSWVDISATGTKSVFYPAGTEPEEDSATAHAPLVLRDSIPYADFLFVNRRGAVETCSALMKEGMAVNMKTDIYALTGKPVFNPERTLMNIPSGGPRRSWSMASGYQTREWAEWWVTEFLAAKRHWMLYKGPGRQAAEYVPVTVKAAKDDNAIYDLSKQQMPSIEFTVTLALEG